MQTLKLSRNVNDPKPSRSWASSHMQFSSSEINPIQSPIRMQMTSDLKKENAHRGEFPKVTNVCRNLACKKLRGVNSFEGRNLFIFSLSGRDHAPGVGQAKDVTPQFFRGRLTIREMTFSAALPARFPEPSNWIVNRLWQHRKTQSLITDAGGPGPEKRLRTNFLCFSLKCNLTLGVACHRPESFYDDTKNLSLVMQTK